MNSNGKIKKHWMLVGSHFGLDSLIIFVSLILGIVIRFGSASDEVFWIHWLFFLLASLIYPCGVYIFGLYNSHSAGTGIFRRSLVVMFCVFISMACLVALTYLDTARPLGRGVTLMGGAIAW